ncbi:hypothetical protein KIN20_030879 [Parelaphostrongylus tenuis]|uniref:Uncharacterized protein n=1 Tax=Parelaphostrongylus tenuis TaxID=148309 RepID=A0AAD5WGS3_PARTN|nr:hypothetical protein KIN20_030879 [Parelaphostrongylus tenuis]
MVTFARSANFNSIPLQLKALVCMTVARPYRGDDKHSAHRPSKDSDESGLPNDPDYCHESDNSSDGSSDDNDNECPYTSDSLSVSYEDWFTYSGNDATPDPYSYEADDAENMHQ